MNELQRDKIQVDELRVLKEIDSIKVDILAYDNPKIDYEDNELVPRAWVLQQTGLGTNTPLPIAINHFGQPPLSVPVPEGYNIYRYKVVLIVDNTPHDEFVVRFDFINNAWLVDTQGQDAYLVAL